MVYLNKKSLFNALLVLLLSGCGNDEIIENNSSENLEEPSNDASEDMVDEEVNSEDNNESPDDSLIGALTDSEPILIEDYADENWFYYDLSETLRFIENEVFIEDDTLYMGSADDGVVSLLSDLTLNWTRDRSYSFVVELAIDETGIYNHVLGSQDTTNYVELLDKDTGEPLYQIDTSGYDEMSELLVDDNSFYLTLGRITDSDDDMYADDFSIHAFNKADGSERWSHDFDGVLLAGGRPHHYELVQNDSFIYLIEAEGEAQKLVARSKEDGSEVWSHSFEDVDTQGGVAYISGNSIYVINRDYIFYVFDEETGEIQAEYDYNGEVPGAMGPDPEFYGDSVFYQDVDQEKHHFKAVNPKADEELWTLDLDGHFLVDLSMLEDTLYAFFGSIDYDAEENTLMARIDPETGEIEDLVDMGESISEKYNNFYRYMGLTEHEGTLVYFNRTHLFGFNE